MLQYIYTIVNINEVQLAVEIWYGIVNAISWAQGEFAHGACLNLINSILCMYLVDAHSLLGIQLLTPIFAAAAFTRFGGRGKVAYCSAIHTQKANAK